MIHRPASGLPQASTSRTRKGSRRTGRPAGRARAARALAATAGCEERRRPASAYACDRGLADAGQRPGGGRLDLGALARMHQQAGQAPPPLLAGGGHRAQAGPHRGRGGLQRHPDRAAVGRAAAAGAAAAAPRPPARRRRPRAAARPRGTRPPPGAGSVGAPAPARRSAPSAGPCGRRPAGIAPPGSAGSDRPGARRAPARIPPHLGPAQEGQRGHQRLRRSGRLQPGQAGDRRPPDVRAHVEQPAVDRRLEASRAAAARPVGSPAAEHPGPGPPGPPPAPPSPARPRSAAAPRTPAGAPWPSGLRPLRTSAAGLVRVRLAASARTAAAVAGPPRRASASSAGTARASRRRPTTAAALAAPGPASSISSSSTGQHRGRRGPGRPPSRGSTGGRRSRSTRTASASAVPISPSDRWACRASASAGRRRAMSINGSDGARRASTLPRRRPPPVRRSSEPLSMTRSKAGSARGSPSRRQRADRLALDLAVGIGQPLDEGSAARGSRASAEQPHRRQPHGRDGVVESTRHRERRDVSVLARPSTSSAARRTLGSGSASARSTAARAPDRQRGEQAQGLEPRHAVGGEAGGNPVDHHAEALPVAAGDQDASARLPQGRVRVVEHAPQERTRGRSSSSSASRSTACVRTERSRDSRSRAARSTPPGQN